MKQYNLIWRCLFTGLVTERETILERDIWIPELNRLAEIHGLTFDIKAGY